MGSFVNAMTSLALKIKANCVEVSEEGFCCADFESGPDHRCC